MCAKPVNGNLALKKPLERPPPLPGVAPWSLIDVSTEVFEDDTSEEEVVLKLTKVELVIIEVEVVNLGIALKVTKVGLVVLVTL